MLIAVFPIYFIIYTSKKEFLYVQIHYHKQL